GAYADVTTGTIATSTAIGYNAQVGCSNCMVLGGTGVNAVSVGIGTTTPSRTLTVAGNAIITGSLHDSVGKTAGTNGMVLQTTGAGTQWVATSSLGLGNPFGASIDAAEMANGDHGFFSYASGVASLDTGGLTSANLISALTDETGTGLAVFNTYPLLNGFRSNASSTITSLTATNATTSLLKISALKDSSNSLGTNGMILQTNGSTAQWVATS